MHLSTIGTPALWIGFVVFVLGMLAIDLGVFHRKAHEVSLKEAAIWSAVWVTVATAVGAAIYGFFGPELGLEFAAGYLIEKALAVDNIFVFALVFSAFAVPRVQQHRVLFWGVLGALVMRAAFILAGGAFLQAVHAATYLFGALLVVTGVKLLVQRGRPRDLMQSFAVRAVRRVLPMTSGYHGARFFVREGGRWLATPLLLALVVIEAADVVFAVDSVPAIFAVTKDPFIVFTSNVLAILGLRSMFFLLSGVLGRLRYLEVGLSAILVFVGAKMLLAGVVKLPTAASLGVIALILFAAVAASLAERAPAAPPATDRG